jgi:hypothetical protein
LKVFRYYVVKNTKYHTQTLTEEDKKIIDQVFIKYAVKFYALSEKYPDPREYAEKIFLKKIQSDKVLGALHTLAIVKNETSDRLFKPGKINKELAKELAEITLEEDSQRGYLDPRDLSEVLKKLEEGGIFIHVEGKDEMRRNYRQIRHPRKKSSASDEINNDRGGKPSAYMITPEFEKLKSVMEKPEAIDLLHNKLIDSNLAFKIEKYKTLIILHAIKMDETVLHKLVKFGASFVKDGIKIGEKELSDFKTIHEQLQPLDDNQLEQVAMKGAELFMKEIDYHKFLIVMCGLFKL